MSGISDAQPLAIPRAIEKIEPPRPSSPRGMWWRHGLAMLALVWSLFPIVFIISAAINPSGTLNTAELLPKNMSMINFDVLFSDTSRPYLTWYKNSMVIAGFGSLASVFIGAVSYTHLRAHETGRNLVCRLLLEKKKSKKT